MTQQAATAPRTPPPTRRIIQGLLSLLLAVAIFYYLLRGIDLAAVWAEIQA
jgi:hypothetical protein